jgi:hypothetical protein
MEGTQVVDEATIYPESAWDVRLKDIEAKFGKWKPIVVSKTSIVVFRMANPVGQTAVRISADLAFPPPDPDSPVIQLNIRRSSPDAQPAD